MRLGRAQRIVVIITLVLLAGELFWPRFYHAYRDWHLGLRWGIVWYALTRANWYNENVVPLIIVNMLATILVSAAVLLAVGKTR